MTHRAVIKVAPLVTANSIDPGAVKPGRTLYQRGSLRFLPGRDSVPLLVDHDPEREIGKVIELVELADTDGVWLTARAEVTDAPGWLRRGTRARFSFLNLQGTQRVAEWERVVRAIVTEVSVLTATMVRVDSLGHVALLRRVAGTPEPQPTAGVICGGPTISRPSGHQNTPQTLYPCRIALPF